MKHIFPLIISCLIGTTVFAQHAVKGTVTDKESKEKLSGASVYVTELNKGTSTNENGEYSVSGFVKGDYKIQVSFLGYQTKIEKINLHNNDTIVNIQIEKASIEVNEVVISGAYTTSQDESSQEIDVVKKSEMMETGASTVMDVISKVPGVTAITTGPLVSRPVIRGLSGNRILTVVDGVRFETQQWDDEHGIGVNEIGMDRVEIIKGPASLLYGPEAMGGVVHFIEEQPAAVGHLTGELYGGMYSNNLGSLAGAKAKGASDKYNWSVDAMGKMLPDYYINGYTFRAPNTRLNEFGGKGSFGINRKWGSSTISYQFNQAYYGILDGKDIVKHPDGSITNKDTAEKDMFPSELEAPYHSVMDNKISSQTNLIAGSSRLKIILGYQNNHRAEFEDNGITKTGYDYVDMTLQSATYDVKWFLPTWKHFSTIVGAMGMYQMNTNSTAAKTMLVPNATINDMGFAALTKYNLKKFNFTVGGRYDSRNLSTVAAQKDSTVSMPAISRMYSNVSGAVGATYDIEEHLLLRANFATGYRSPNLNELMSNGVKLESRHYEIGNMNFVREQNNEMDLSAIFKSKHFSLEAAAFLNNINNFIYLAPTGDSVNSNIASGTKVARYQFMQANAQIKGIEMGIDIHPQAISWVHYEVKAETLDAIRTDDDSYLPMMPTDKIYNTLYFNFKECKKFKNIFARIGTITALDQFKVASNELKTPGYTILNASFGVSRNIWKFNNIQLVLAVNNATDKMYYDNMSRLRPFGVYNPGRNIILSLRIPFDIKQKE
ncbi:MAG TPA: TonB-dependent receptor [Bacteroidia bacterium]